MPNEVVRENRRKERVGVVTSDKMQKTIVVQVKRKAPHPLYGKVIEQANKFKAHDEMNEAKIGDRVRIVETRPLSKDKRWRLVEVLSRGHQNSSNDVKDVPAAAGKVKK
jgi:small subunit ribosomal protein S17